jgi:propionyl-CoA synthetase
MIRRDQRVAHLHLRRALDLTARFAGGLQQLGVGLGDQVIITMPNLPEAVVAMLACAFYWGGAFGGVWWVCAAEVGLRIDDAQPRHYLRFRGMGSTA